MVIPHCASICASHIQIMKSPVTKTKSEHFEPNETEPSVTGIKLCLVLSQPHGNVSKIMFSFSRKVKWTVQNCPSHILDVTLRCWLSYEFIFLFSCAGTLIYFTYGIRNSFSSNILYQLVPEEERILMPSSPTYNVGAPQSVDQLNSSISTSGHFINFDSYTDTDAVLIE